jgi:NitT/TauT family transport system substrate-binding protein
VIGVSGLSSTSLYLNTNNPAIKSLADFTEKDRIALPGVKTSLSAVVLQMAAAKQFGVENYAKLDPITVSLPHPEALTVLLAGRTEVTGAFHLAAVFLSRTERPQDQARAQFRRCAGQHHPRRGVCVEVVR